MTPFDWSRINFTEHMTEAAVVLAECHVVLRVGAEEHATYEFKVCESVGERSDEPYFAVGINRDDPSGYRPFDSGTTPEEALQACLLKAAVYHRRQVKQAGDAD